MAALASLRLGLFQICFNAVHEFCFGGERNKTKKGKGKGRTVHVVSLGALRATDEPTSRSAA